MKHFTNSILELWFVMLGVLFGDHEATQRIKLYNRHEKIVAVILFLCVFCFVIYILHIYLHVVLSFQN